LINNRYLWLNEGATFYAVGCNLVTRERSTYGEFLVDTWLKRLVIQVGSISIAPPVVYRSWKMVMLLWHQYENLITR